MRIDKFLSNTGYGTRNEVKKLIKDKKVYINNKLVLKTSQNINENIDKVEVDGILAKYKKYVYLMLNKSGDCISATTSYKEKTVIDYVPEEYSHYELFPMGRLDKDTQGLLILTNDGKLSHEVLSPKHHVPKKYYAKIQGIVTNEDIEKFKNGLDIGEKKLTKEAFLEIININEKENTSEIEVTITEGKYHQVKRMFEEINCKVTFLKRIQMGQLMLDESLKLGEIRELEEFEVELLKKF